MDCGMEGLLGMMPVLSLVLNSGTVSGSCLRVYEKWTKASSLLGNSQAWVQKGPLPPEN